MFQIVSMRRSVESGLPRRDFLKLAGLAGVGVTTSARLLQTASAAENQKSGPQPEGKADYTVRIGTGLIDLAPNQIVSTSLYNGQFPGPLLRFKEGQSVTVDIFNDTDTPEQLHWHGLMIPVDVDGAAEEGTPYIPARGMRRLHFTPRPAGFRFYHTHLTPRDNLNLGQYTGQVGPVYIEPRHTPGAYDQEIFLTLKEFAPVFSRGGDMAMDFLAGEEIASLKSAGESAMKASLAAGAPRGYEVSYSLFSINGRMLGHGEPIRVKQGQRVLLHVLNGSATEIRSLALPHHQFKIVALDGNPVPNPVELAVLWLGTAERISAIVEMNHPGVWILGDTSDDDREHGMGIVVEYAKNRGTPKWIKPPKSKWDYTQFALPNATEQTPDETIDMTFAKHNAADNGFNLWTINGTPFSMEKMQPMFSIHEGKKYRLRMHNESDDIHPVHLHRHSFELTKIAGKNTAGVIKDVVMLGGYQEIEVDFTADDPGLTLFHCHQQVHMDFGFMALFNYV